MSRKCDVCGKGPLFGNNVSHSNKKTRTKWEPNLKKVKVMGKNGKETIKICMDCLSSNKVDIVF